MINEKLKCPECNGTVFTLYGIFREDYGWKIFFKCAKFDCGKMIEHSGPFFEIIQKGMYCLECKKFTRDSYWDKSKRGYQRKCHNCGHEYFEPE